jgi:polyisoprenoid-binding protein YceI
MITHVKGVFTDYNATINTDGEDLMHAQLALRILPASINTGDASRDQHLRSADFFDVDQHPEILFVARSHEKTADDAFTLFGDLTIKGITKPIHLHVEIGGMAKDPWGNHKAGLTVTGKINRKDWGLNWNATLETGGVLVGEEIKIHADIQLIRQS